MTSHRRLFKEKFSLSSPLFLGGLLGGLGDLTGTSGGLLDGLDDTDLKKLSVSNLME